EHHGRKCRAGGLNRVWARSQIRIEWPSLSKRGYRFRLRSSSYGGQAAHPGFLLRPDPLAHPGMANKSGASRACETPASFGQRDHSFRERLFRYGVPTHEEELAMK